MKWSFGTCSRLPILITQKRLSSYFEPYDLSLVQRAFLLSYFGVQSVLDPTKANLVAGFNDTINTKFFTQALLMKMLSTPHGKLLMKTKPLLSTQTLNLPGLLKLPENTMGHAYAKFMTHHSYSPDERTVVRFTTNADLAYISARYRQVHDFWHVLVALPTSVLGEVALKAFEASHTNLPSAIVSATIGTLPLTFSEKSLYLHHYLPWAISAGIDCNDLLSFDYEGHLSSDLNEVRQLLRICKAPPAPSG